MKHIFPLVIICLCMNVTKAQTYVTIPDANFVTWLQANVPSAMNGNQMDITSTAVTTGTVINLSYGSIYYYINDLTGIQYFTALKKLDCTAQAGLTYPSNLPNSLEILNIIQVNSPISYLPSNLISLSCGPHISSLPTLPITLQELNVYGAPTFTILPTLPNSLTKLYISSSNPMTFSLPSNLEEFTYWGGGSTSVALPNFPNSLKMLSVNYCNANPLPPIPNGLKSLTISQCATNLPAILPDSLTFLDCSMSPANPLTVLPNGLKYLDCHFGSMTSIPILPDSLEYLNCSSSQSLTAIPDLPKGLKTLNCSACPLVHCIPPLPNTLQSIALSASITCLPNYVAAMPPSYFNYPICEVNNTITNPNNCPKAIGISGYTYFDVNNNCHDELTETQLKNIELKLKDNNNIITEYLSTGLNGSYTFWESVGIYNVVVDTVNKPYKGYCHTTGIDTSIVLTALQPNADSANFSIKCKSGFDVGVQSVVTSGWVFPGQTHHLKINAGDMAKWYGLNCASGISGQMIVNVSGPVSYSTSAVGALIPIVSGNTFTYTITDFGNINNATDFNLIFKTDTTAITGDTICVSISLTPNSGDTYTVNNTYNYCYLVSNSHDPNKKEVYPIDVLPNYHDWFTYTIHFQNTGSAPAMNIRLKDTLDSNLDIETLQVINYSHPNTWQIYNNGLVFNFQNIQLPDSTSNSIGSQGFVQYRIKPKATWTAPTKIKNTAYIYFDFNSPIVTNTTLNSFITYAGLNEQVLNNIISVYPNPNNGDFVIETSTVQNKLVQLYDVTGNVVFEKAIEGLKNTINTSNLANGIYTLKISGVNGISTKKLVIVK